MDPVLATFRPLTAEPAQGRQVFSRRRGRCCWCRSSPARSWRTPITTGAASTASRSTTSCRSTSCATCTSRRRSSGSACRGSAPACFWRRRSPAGGKPRARRFLVDLLFWVTLLIVAGALIGNYLGIMGYIGTRLVLVRQSGAVLHPARPLLADRLLRRPGCCGACWCSARCGRPRRAVAQATRQFWSGAHPAREPDLGLHHQHRRALRVRHDPAHRDREVLHDHRFLALVGGPSVGRAVVRVLRRRA